MTNVKTVDATNTVTETATDKETTVVPTTVVSQYTTTEVINETETTERVVETTIAEVRTLKYTSSFNLSDRLNRHRRLKSPKRSLLLPPSLAPFRRLH